MTAGGLEPKQLERLLDVGRTLVAELDLEAVLGRVLDAARELTGARYAALGILDPDKRELERFLFVGIDEEARRRIGPLPRGHGLLGELIREPRSLRLADISDHPHSYGFPAEHPPMTTFLGGPVMIRGDVYGNLYLTDKEGGAEFGEADEQLLVVLAEWAAIAIDNARSHQASEVRRRELERAMRGLQATADLSREVESETDLDRVLELVVKRGRALVEARACAALLLEDGELRVAAVAGEVPSETIGAALPDSGVPFEVLRGGVGQRVAASALIPLEATGLAASSGLLIPLRSRGTSLGVLVALDRLGDDPAFEADDELALSAFATSAAGAISATRAFEDEKLRLSIFASEQERRRWARELHDETLQELGALKVAQQSALEVDDVQAMRNAMAQASEQVDRMIAGLEGLITELRPAALDQLGTQAAVEALIDRVGARHGLEISADFDLAYEEGRAPTRHDPELEATMYRLVQEALSNVVKHADAARVRVAIEERDSSVTVTVEDDGRGLGEGGDRRGFGQLGMRERVALAKGEISIGPGPKGGTRVMAELPAVRREA